MAEYAAIVLSAGSGKRMKSDIPKQYMDLLGKPVIYYSLKAFEESEISRIVLVAGEADLEYCRKDIVERYGFRKVTAVVPGGKERYDSVYEGLKRLSGADYVLIHDGARPMVDQGIIKRQMDAVKEYHACVAAVPVKDTIKLSNTDGFVDHTPDRSLLWSVQTPQTFSYPLICRAYEQVYRDLELGENVPSITDDAMVAEYASGEKVKLVEGSYQNIKITTPEDLQIAKVFLGEDKTAH